MSNNNGDMPAMPITNNGVSMSEGLSKRERFAVMAAVPVEIITESLKQWHPGGFTVDQYIAAAVRYKKEEADALLAALEDK